MTNFFVTGTDTNIGKTYISVGLLKLFNQKGLRTVGLKPIASGCYRENGELRNDDAVALQTATSLPIDYSLVNPFAFEPAIAPHVAAMQTGKPLTLTGVSQAINHALAIPADVFIIEGAGGWMVPLNAQELIADLVVQFKFPIILVVGIKLGCINHTMLTVNAIQQAQLPFAGWVANCCDNTMEAREDSIQWLSQHIAAPLLGVVPFGAKPEEYLHIDLL